MDISEIEATFSDNVKNLSSKEDVKKFFQREFGLYVDRVFDNLFTKIVTNDIKIYKNVSEYIKKLFINGFYFESNYSEIINTIITQNRYTDFCTSGESILTIDTKGKIWGCQLYVDKEVKALGDIDGELIENNNLKTL